MASYFKSNQRLDLPPHKPHSSAQRSPSDAQQRQSKFYSFFLKGAFIAIAIVLLPLYPSQAPEFTNHTIFNRGWEFLRLGIIGVALSYGLLSRRRAETEKEIQAQIDSTQSYVSKILQVSPVFDNENDAATYNDSGKGQTWSSLYSPSEPMVMVAAEEDDYYHRRLSLPVRSLRSGRPDAEASASVHKVPDVKGGRPATVSANARSAYSIRNGKREIGVSNLSNLHGNAEGNVVLPSPIPWGSRSGRLEAKEGIGLRPPGVVPPSVSESELPASPSPVPWGSRPSSASTPSPRSSPSHSVSPTRRPASVQKAAINPTPTFVSANIDSVSNAANELVTQDKNLRRNVKHSESFDESLVGKSVRRVRKSESMNSRSGVGNGLADESRERRSRRSSEPCADENSARKNRDGNYVMADKPERQNRGTKNEPEETLSRKSRETESSVAGKTEKKNREAEVMMVEKTQRKSIYEPPPPPPPLQEFVKYQRIWKKEKIDELKAQTEESTEIDEDDDEEEEEHEQEQERKNDVHTHTETEAAERKPVGEIGETVIDANEVDKKADEFIAKFREQIRLQRIESIKRASAQKKKAKPASAT
ncbi:uncharacterized protein LOC116266440 [Nymphaea colorata]|uniref:DUF4408 domain-containing protein n=1 Tax=Nymphaea colorata TaxID=210225 RepID=A0A5K0YKC6_9MAGN|nr:uncharacterized protein LOC116266440 [Nymphaea colorata]VVV77899.1 unnamed protein product [Nymphaea colorata]